MNKKCFNLDVKNKLSEICISLLKISDENMNPTKIIEKFEMCFMYTNMLIELQKDYSFINSQKIRKTHEDRKYKSKEMLDNYISQGLISKVFISHSKVGKGLGLFAKEPINKYELTMSIPAKEIITEHESYLSKFGEFLKSNDITKTMPNISLSLYLLNEYISRKSVHSNYIESLPLDMDTFLYFKPEDIRLLRYSPYLYEIVHQFWCMCCHYCYFLRTFLMGKPIDCCWFQDNFCFEDFRWAVSIVMSRNNAIPSPDGKSTILALIPMWDMMNHKHGEVTTDFVNEKVLFYSMESYEPNDEICMDYGKRTNFQYFMYSGFIPEKNLYDKYKFQPTFNKQDNLFQLKQQILSKLSIDCSNPTFMIDCNKSDIITPDLLLYLSVMLNRDNKILEQFLLSSTMENDILKYCETVKSDVKTFIENRYQISIKCIDTILKQVNVGQNLIAEKFLTYERRIIVDILEKVYRN